MIWGNKNGGERAPLTPRNHDTNAGATVTIAFRHMQVRDSKL